MTVETWKWFNFSVHSILSGLDDVLRLLYRVTVIAYKAFIPALHWLCISGRVGARCDIAVGVYCIVYSQKKRMPLSGVSASACCPPSVLK